MMDNHQYNLLLQTVQEHKSAWRIKHQYLDDAAECAECKNFWEKLLADKEKHIQELESLVKSHI